MLFSPGSLRLPKQHRLPLMLGRVVRYLTLVSFFFVTNRLLQLSIIIIKCLLACLPAARSRIYNFNRGSTQTCSCYRETTSALIIFAGVLGINKKFSPVRCTCFSIRQLESCRGLSGRMTSNRRNSIAKERAFGVCAAKYTRTSGHVLRFGYLTTERKEREF